MQPQSKFELTHVLKRQAFYISLCFKLVASPISRLKSMAIQSKRNDLPLVKKYEVTKEAQKSKRKLAERIGCGINYAVS